MKIGEEEASYISSQKKVFNTIFLGFWKALKFLNTFLCLIRYGRRIAIQNRNRDKAIQMSYVINFMSFDMKKLLTLNENGKVITPQRSFIDYFSSQDLDAVDVVEFSYRFVVFYNRLQDSVVKSFESSSPHKSLAEINAFWKEFMVVVESFKGPENMCGCLSIKTRLQILLVSFSQRIRRFMRVLFSGSGLY